MGENNEKTKNDDSGIWIGTTSIHGCWSGAKLSGSPGAHPNSLRRRRNRQSQRILIRKVQRMHALRSHSTLTRWI